MRKGKKKTSSTTVNSPSGVSDLRGSTKNKKKTKKIVSQKGRERKNKKDKETDCKQKRVKKKQKHKKNNNKKKDKRAFFPKSAKDTSTSTSS